MDYRNRKLFSLEFFLYGFFILATGFAVGLILFGENPRPPGAWGGALTFLAGFVTFGFLALRHIWRYLRTPMIRIENGKVTQSVTFPKHQEKWSEPLSDYSCLSLDFFHYSRSTRSSVLWMNGRLGKFSAYRLNLIHPDPGKNALLGNFLKDPLGARNTLRETGTAWNLPARETADGETLVITQPGDFSKSIFQKLTEGALILNARAGQVPQGITVEEGKESVHIVVNGEAGGTKWLLWLFFFVTPAFFWGLISLLMGHPVQAVVLSGGLVAVGFWLMRSAAQGDEHIVMNTREFRVYATQSHAGSGTSRLAKGEENSRGSGKIWNERAMPILEIESIQGPFVRVISAKKILEIEFGWLPKGDQKWLQARLLRYVAIFQEAASASH